MAAATVSRSYPSVKAATTMPAAAPVAKAAQPAAPILTPATAIEQTTTPDIPQQDGGAAAPPAKMPRKRQRTSAEGAASSKASGAVPADPATATVTPTTEEKATGSENGSWLIVAKSVRTLLKNMPENVHCSADALPMLNSRVQELLHEAAARAAGNSRKTLKPCDF